jgi:hypothetical protein
MALAHDQSKDSLSFSHLAIIVPVDKGNDAPFPRIMPDLLSPEIQRDPQDEDGPRNSRHGSKPVLIASGIDPRVRFEGEEKGKEG